MDFELGKNFRSTSYTCRSLLEKYVFLKKGLSCEVEDGEYILDFLLDGWLGEGPLMDLSPSVLPSEVIRDSIASYLQQSGSSDSFVLSFSIVV